jgi:hypothetical protein
MKLLRFLPGDEIPGFDSSLLRAQKANEHLSTNQGDARCSLWWDVVPKLEGERLGVVGHFQADSPEAASFVLEQAAGRLREKGCTLAVGAMDGNTWRRYRVLTERGNDPGVSGTSESSCVRQAEFLYRLEWYVRGTMAITIPRGSRDFLLRRVTPAVPREKLNGPASPRHAKVQPEIPSQRFDRLRLRHSSRQSQHGEDLCPP